MEGMVRTATQRSRIIPAATSYWRDCVGRSGVLRGSREFLSTCWGFVRDSTPARLRSRFGDADYDWDYRVNTTSGAVGWRDRLLGVFSSPYQPTEAALFHQMIDELARRTRINFAEFTFLDLGSGKGRVLLMASDYPFRRILGVELLAALHQIAEQNIAQYRSDSQKCFALESRCADATVFPIPQGPLVLYLFNPFPEAGLRRAMANLEQDLERKPRTVYVLYHNPQLEAVLTEGSRFHKLGATHQYSIFAAVS
jgi:SAM-dependent methyltransferase